MYICTIIIPLQREILLDPSFHNRELFYFMERRVNVYIDGFNFYYGLKSKYWKKYYWLDIVAFYELFMKEGQILNKVYYFTAVPFDTGQRKRQSLFLTANRDNPKFEVVYGKFLKKEIHHKGNIIHTFEEKQTDVNIAVNLIRNVVLNNCETSIIVSADSDLVPPINLVKELNTKHKLFFHFPPKRHSVNLQQLSDGIINLERYESRFKKCLLPDVVNLSNGYTINKPPSWV